MTPVRSVRAVGTAGVGARWRRDNRPDFPGIAVWVDAVAEVEVEVGVSGEFDREVGADGFEGCDERADLGAGAGAWAGGRGNGGVEGVGGRGEAPGDLDDGYERVPWVVDAWSPEYAKVWRPLSGAGREPRPGLLLSVVRAGGVTAYPTPLADPPVGAMARALARLERPETAVRDRKAEAVAANAERVPPEPRRAGSKKACGEVLAVDAESVLPEPRRVPSQKAYGEVRALVGVLVEVLVGRRAVAHAAPWTDAEVRGKLRKPRYARTATLKSVRLAESGAGVEALALLRDGGRTRAVALRFDRAEDARWRCTALQTG
jgi:hypothetical protein